MTLENILLKKFGDSFKPNVNLSNYSWFNLGGNAEYFYKAKNKKQLIEFLQEVKLKKIKSTILGAGSNTLFRDKGVKGVVIIDGRKNHSILFELLSDEGSGTLIRQ